MDLRYPANRYGADLHKAETSEVARFEDVYVSLVGEQDVRLALERVPVHGPQTAAQALMVLGCSVIRIVHVVVVDGSETHE